MFFYANITSCASTLKNSNLVLRPLTPPSFRHLRDGMPPPLSREASLFYRLKSAFYKFKFLKGNRNTQINLRLQFLPPLKGEVAKVDNFNCQLLAEGSGQPINLIFRFYRHNELFRKETVLWKISLMPCC